MVDHRQSLGRRTLAEQTFARTERERIDQQPQPVEFAAQHIADGFSAGSVGKLELPAPLSEAAARVLARPAGSLHYPIERDERRADDFTHRFWHSLPPLRSQPRRSSSSASLPRK